MKRVRSIVGRFGKMNSVAATSGGRCKTVIVEGNIASGKTVFLEYFRKFSNVKIYQEPVEQWRNLNGHNLLDLLYRDQSRWSFAFQMYADLTRLSQHHSKDDVKPTDTKLMERSLFSGKYCFAENSFRSGSINPVEYAVLNEYFQWMTKNLPEMLHVDLIVYLRTKPENCQQRLVKRCRREEINIPLEYLTSLHGLYEEWLIEKRQPVPAELIVVDANDDLSAMFGVYDQLAEKILGNEASNVGKNISPEKTRLYPSNA